MNILVIAPHPDDEVLGCGGTIDRFASEGNSVTLCIVYKTISPGLVKRIYRQEGSGD